MIELIEKHKLNIENRDGELFAAMSIGGECYLILEAETIHLPPKFKNMDSVNFIEITFEAYKALTGD